jgi:hypothetical protein
MSITTNFLSSLRGGGGHGGYGLKWLTYPHFLYLNVDQTVTELVNYYTQDLLINNTWGNAYGDYRHPSTLGSGGGKPGFTDDFYTYSGASFCMYCYFSIFFNFVIFNIVSFPPILTFVAAKPLLGCQGGGAIHLNTRISNNLSKIYIYI